MREKKNFHFLYNSWYWLIIHAISIFSLSLFRYHAYITFKYFKYITQILYNKCYFSWMKNSLSDSVTFELSSFCKSEQLESKIHSIYGYFLLKYQVFQLNWVAYAKLEPSRFQCSVKKDWIHIKKLSPMVTFAGFKYVQLPYKRDY